MRKIFNKIICFTVAAVATAGVLTASACSSTYKSDALKGDYSKGTPTSNGGFAVEKGDYIYFINGKEVNTADNTYGTPVKGAIMRIAKTSLAEHDYSNVQTVVPQIAYSGNSNAGIFVYGDYVYYATPSTQKDSDGEIQNSYIEFKSSKLDGTEAMKDFYVQYSDNAIEYRFVEEDGVVYLLYVATSEKLFDEETGVTNLHSYNTKTKTDTLLAYNVDSVTFDKDNLENYRVFYTMKVTDFELNKTYSNYNQLYTVTAKAERTTATGKVDYTEYLTEALADEDEVYDASKDPKYVNCGKLVYDGIGLTSTDKLTVTPFNGKDADKVTRGGYTYAVSSYQKGNLFYTRTSSTGGSKLFDLKVSEIEKSDWAPVTGNPADTACLSDNGDAASNFTYIFDDKGNIEKVLITNAQGLIRTVLNDNNQIVPDYDGEDYDGVDTFYLATDGQPTILYVDYSNKYIYYSVSKNANGYSVNGYSVNRINYDGTSDKYNKGLDVSEDEYTPVCILDLDVASSWYKPEMFYGQLLFPTQTENMTEYTYIMACDLNGLNNTGIKSLNEKYKEINDKITGYDSGVYENLQEALKFAWFADESEYGYLDELIQAFVDIKGYDKERYWSAQSVEIYNDFVNATGDWAEYKTEKGVAANKRDYYYAVLGVMNDADAEDYSSLIKSNLEAYPEAEQTWFESLSTGAKVGFIIGVVAGGIILIAAAAIVSMIIVRKRKSKLPVYKKQRIKVDTTDDKDIDVYSDEQ